MEQQRIRLLIDSTLGNVSLVGVAVNRLCGLISRAEIDPYDMELCVVEAVNNSIEHAYRKKEGQEVEVILSVHGDRLVVEVCDTGNPLDPALLTNQSATALRVDEESDRMAEQGRGLAIIKEIMDQVFYEKREGKNCLTMVKKFASGKQ